MAPQPDAAGRYTDKDMTIILDAKSNQDWIVPRRVMCAFFWIGIILLFTGIILLVTSKHKGEVYRSWGAILLGLGFCLLLICLILCLHAYCVITITEEDPIAKINIHPPPPSMILNGRKPKNKGESRMIEVGDDEEMTQLNMPPMHGKPVQLLIVDKSELDELERGKPLYFREQRSGGFSPGSQGSIDTQGAETSTVSHTVLGDVHVSVRPSNPAFGVPSQDVYDVESTETQIKGVHGPVPPDIPLHLLENLDEQSSAHTTPKQMSPREKASMSPREKASMSPREKASPQEKTPREQLLPREREHVIIPTKYAGAFTPVKSSSGNSSRSNPDGANTVNNAATANTYIGYQEGLDINAFPLGQILTAKPPPIPGRHNSQIHAHVIPIPYSHYRNYPIGIVPPPPPRSNAMARVIAQNMAMREEAVKMQMIPNGQQIRINMPENYIQRIPPEHDHDGRRFSQPVVVYLNPNQNMGLSQLSVYDNVQYVWAEPPAQSAAAPPQ